MDTEVFKLSHDLADIWVARDGNSSANYAYGGTRMVKTDMQDGDVDVMVRRLMHDESMFKNRMINLAIRNGVLDDLGDRLPQGFLESVVGGARCIIRPRSDALATILNNPTDRRFQDTITPIFAEIGVFLNQRSGDIKLTPDFGRFSGLSDLLAEFTPHVLGIRCEAGGCGGKSSYSTTGIIAALELHDIATHRHMPVTLIGSNGALGVDVLAYFLRESFTDLAVCDLAYDDESGRASPQAAPPVDVRHLPSKDGTFTDACLSRGGVIVATTVGEELQNSNWRSIPSGTLLFLAHNLAIPVGEAGLRLARDLAAQGVHVVPGQVLTLGGALTSRVEWFWRQARVNEPFDKPLAHLVVAKVVRYLVDQANHIANAKGITPYEATLALASAT